MPACLTLQPLQALLGSRGVTKLSLCEFTIERTHTHMRTHMHALTHTHTHTHTHAHTHTHTHTHARMSHTCTHTHMHAHTHTHTSGGTQSDAVILSASGEVVGQASGPGTNPWVSRVGQPGSCAQECMNLMTHSPLLLTSSSGNTCSSVQVDIIALSLLPPPPASWV